MFVTYLICCHQLYVLVSFYYGSLIVAVLRHIYNIYRYSRQYLLALAIFINFFECCLHHSIILQIHILCVCVCVQISFICFSVKKNKYHASMLHLSLCFSVALFLSLSLFHLPSLYIIYVCIYMYIYRFIYLYVYILQVFIVYIYFSE